LNRLWSVVRYKGSFPEPEASDLQRTCLDHYSACNGDFVLVWRFGRAALRGDGANEGIEIIDNALIEAIKLRSPLGLKPCVGFDGAEKACGE
jgi:hypothetical protein